MFFNFRMKSSENISRNGWNPCSDVTVLSWDDFWHVKYNVCIYIYKYIYIYYIYIWWKIWLDKYWNMHIIMIIYAIKPYGHRMKCVFYMSLSIIVLAMGNLHPHLPTLATISAALWCHRAVKAGRAAPTAVLNLRENAGQAGSVESYMYW